MLSLGDVQKLQALYPECRVELRDGSIVIMSPSDIRSALVGAAFLAALHQWVRPRRLGFVFDASAGFRLPGGNLTAPDVSYVSRERLQSVPRTYGELTPDLVVEVKSSTDSIEPLRQKLAMYLAEGARVAVLVDPDAQTITLYRPGRALEVLSGDDSFTLPELLPGWSLPLSELWLRSYDGDA